MSDLIRRQDVLKICDKYNGQGWVWSMIRKEVEELPPVNPQEPKTGHWVPVGERLPTENEEVLVTTVWGEVTIGERYSTIDYFINDGAVNANEDEIIAWMPLPKPYKAESEVKDKNNLSTIIEKIRNGISREDLGFPISAEFYNSVLSMVEPQESEDE